MDITLPTDCGNAPRIGIVEDFVVGWAQGDEGVVSDWLGDEASWVLVGRGTYHGPEAAREVRPPLPPTRVVVLSVITHGRFASCDGYLESAGQRIDFSHVFRFASTSKAAKIAELRSYCVGS